jgi:hypothetical protein
MPSQGAGLFGQIQFAMSVAGLPTTNQTISMMTTNQQIVRAISDLVSEWYLGHFLSGTENQLSH